MRYPEVVGEFETIRKICKGFSIGRVGDGNLKVMEKHVYTRQLTPAPALAKEIRTFITNPHPKCLIGIPTMDPKGTKYENWQRSKQRFLKYFNDTTGIKYYSAFITRPDCGAWMETREYYEEVLKIWAGKPLVAVVSEVDSKLLSFVRLTNAVVHIACPMYGAYAEVNRLEREVVGCKPDLALLSCGPTANALAHRLTKRGIQAVDMGSIGGFLWRWYRGGPVPESYQTERQNWT